MGADNSWPPMIWVGGGPGAGKSTVAWRLSRRHDLPLHPVDLWAYDHAARLPGEETLDDELVQGPEYAARAFQQNSEARLTLVRADILGRTLGAVPALVEGPQLFPAFAARVGLQNGFGVWLVPTPARTRRAREARIQGAPHARARSRLEGILARDIILAERIRDTAERAGSPVLEVADEPDWDDVERWVETSLMGALAGSPRLSAGPSLSRQRRFENRVACRQGRLWQMDAALAELPPYPFACECGQSGCDAVWGATPDAYDDRTRERLLDLHGNG